MRSIKHDGFNFIVHAKDHFTKFSWLFALPSKEAHHVALHLRNLFLYIWSSENSAKANIILNLKLNWPDLIIINGRPRHPQRQGLVERVNAVVQKMLGKWLETNKSLDWPQGFVQKQTPYEMVFGQSVRNDHDFWLQLHQQSINKTIVDEEELPESLADNLNLNDHSLIDNNSEYADACSPIPILSTNTYVLQNDNNDTQTSHKRIREEAEKNYIRTTETMVCASEIVSCVMNMVIYPLEMVINRPDKMKNVCLADFALLYNVSKKKADNARITENSDDEDIMDNAIDEKTIELKMKNGKDPLYSFSKLIDNNSEYADACSPIPILSSNTYVLQNDNNDTQASHKRIREEAEKNYIRTVEHSSTKQQLLAVVAVDFSPSILRAHFPTITDSQINAALKHIYRFGEKVL
ncbi:unnamed protein product [Rotaria socialis]